MKYITTKELNKKAYAYILDSIDSTDYDVTLTTDESKLKFLYGTFVNEMGWNISRIGAVNAFREWLMGLPGAIRIEWENYKIIELAKEWGSIPENATDKEEQKILDNYWNLIAVKTFQLFRKYKIKRY